MQHPFLKNEEIINFEELKPECIVNDIEEGIKICKENIQKIKEIPINQSTFENTVRPFDNAIIPLKDIMYKLNILILCRSDIKEYSLLNEEIFSKEVSFKSSIYTDNELFKLIEYNYKQKEVLEFDQRQLIEKIYNDFIDGGILLNDSQKNKFIQLKEEVFKLSKKYLSNVINDTDNYSLLIEDKNKLDGIPSNILEHYFNEAQKRKLKGYLITLQASSYLPLLKYCKNEEIRKEIFIQYNSLCSKGEYDNTNIINKVLEKRQEIAKLLGYSNYSEYITKRRMVKSSKNAMNFIEDLHKKILSFFKREVEEIIKYKKEQTGNSELNPWDINFYIEQIKEKQLKYNEEEIRQYFPEPIVFKVLFEVYKRLYGITFCYNKSIKGWHQDVKYYDIIDSNNKRLGGVYFDLYSRKGKKAGGFHDVLRTNYLNEQGILIKPLGVVVCNFLPPNNDTISYFSHSELKTLFHESGHLMHTILSKQRFASLTGMNVEWDFVELPSQIMENWIYEKEVFHLFNEVGGIKEIPQDIYNKIIQTRIFMSAFYMMRQLKFSKIDLELHQHYIQSNLPLDDFISLITENYDYPFSSSSLSIIRHFSHLFNLTYCYASGYYSYKWAEILEADAFELFKENGIFNSLISTKFKTSILEMGGSKPASELFKEFRGRNPDPSALLKKLNLIDY
ncbi:oligopeptidase A, putative [Entamoeba histolytica HM-1:IMSS-B]|uniref:Peptidase M3A/M3B catalytic domain-containing protein n=6 Tax=Entamoeba histolytica TaxID=5759 RepID=C4M1I8_ENTH1|nr:hypothetical protein EHI_001080 [Entamoeba histolytica HM-1:IMSS]EMD45334.1 oligopeptidase, putative [Entamoeba histolytica KU27]EMH75180.1 oligopeptidase A, putative [Entamoeba histolytica HM-1:IMSS-B]EMS16063.1 oligopeptidase A, putative [Entamoeba histolytica HM-3:IMSS]ENY65792.1 oligopeptidase A, putative [Entamoeba histolytica HM-1:IMSS-A]GAT95082.1 hypothetical protein CL6EHI_001080 [Entamoeba histolytica]|eukprot:XP_649877.1 hypothetical protein EHI_001080 [Entamoeba histolytica HM-1:IMSS]